MIKYKFKSKLNNEENISVIWMYFSHSEHELASVYVATQSVNIVDEIIIENLFQGKFFQSFYSNNLKILVFISGTASKLDNDIILYCDPISQKIYPQINNKNTKFEIKNILTIKEKINNIPKEIISKNTIQSKKIQEERVEIQRNLTINHPEINQKQSQKLEKIKNKFKKQRVNIISWKTSNHQTEIIYKIQVTLISELQYHEKFINTREDSMGYFEVERILPNILREKIERFQKNHSIKIKTYFFIDYKIGNSVSFSLFNIIYKGVIIKIEHLLHFNEQYTILEIIYNQTNRQIQITYNKAGSFSVQNIKLIDIFQRIKNTNREVSEDDFENDSQDLEWSKLEDFQNFEDIKNIEEAFNFNGIIQIDELSDKLKKPLLYILKEITQCYLIK